MKKCLILLFQLIFSSLFAQSNNARWTDLFSYADVKFIEEVQGNLYCATENGIFVYNQHQPAAELIKYNKTNILSNVGISAMDYDATSNILMIGYENGAIDLLTEGNSTIVLDIPWNNFTGSKKVNHISINGDIALISGDFGVVSYSLTQNEFLETTFFYQNGNYVKVREAMFFNDKVYALTGEGIYSYRLVNGTNFPNFQVWQRIDIPGSTSWDYRNIEIFNQELYISSSHALYKLNASDQFTLVGTMDNIRDLQATHDKIAITQADRITFVDANNQTIVKSTQYLSPDTNQIQPLPLHTGIFFQGKYYGASEKLGLIDFDLSNEYATGAKGYHPDGPYNNKSYAVTVKNQKIWIAPGGISDFNIPTSNGDGFYYFDKFKWNHFSSKTLLNAKDFVKIAVNPTNENQFVAIPYFEQTEWTSDTRIGFFEFTLQGETYTYNHITSPLKWLYRTAGANYDSNGDLYVSSSFPDPNADEKSNFYYQRKGQTWKTSQISSKTQASTALSPAFSSDYVWFPNARYGGLTVLDKNMNEVVTLMKSNADLYEDSVLTVAVDQNNTVWIGTLLGLTVLYGGDTAIAEGNYKTEPIVIVQDGIPEALLTSTRINSIKVDKANRKWIATNAAGVYYVSDNGEQTIHHFNSKNSPLPSDIVYDVEIDDSNGKVYFATEKGVVVFNGDVQDVGDKFDLVLAYPNPVRPNFKGNVVIKNIPNRASVKITDITGNLMYEAKSQGGIVEWDTKNNKGKEVASGIYLVLMTNADGTETKTLKIAVVR